MTCLDSFDGVLLTSFTNGFLYVLIFNWPVWFDKLSNFSWKLYSACIIFVSLIRSICVQFGSFNYVSRLWCLIYLICCCYYCILYILILFQGFLYIFSWLRSKKLVTKAYINLSDCLIHSQRKNCKRSTKLERSKCPEKLLS